MVDKIPDDVLDRVESCCSSMSPKKIKSMGAGADKEISYFLQTQKISDYSTGTIRRETINAVRIVRHFYKECEIVFCNPTDQLDAAGNQIVAAYAVVSVVAKMVFPTCRL